MNWLTQLAGDLARWTTRRLVRCYYPKIEVTGRERIPAAGAVLLTPNHPNSLMDPVIVGIAAGRRVRYFAKAPLFDVPVFGNVLRALGMVPAFRGSDDAGAVKRNLESLAAGARLLAQGETVGIFPEGKSHDHLKVEQVRTGTARMALQAVQSGASGLKIVPVGITYERKERFRSAVWVRVGEPLDVAAWLKEHGDDERKAMRSLTAEIDRRLKELVIHLHEEQWEPFVDDLEVLLPPPPESARNPLAVLRWRKRIADAMNHFLAADRPRAEALAAAIQQHREKLTAVGLSLRSALLRWRGWRLALQLAWEAIYMDLGFLLVLIGTLHHLLPFALTRLIARFLQAPGRSTIALARLGAGIPIYGAWYGFTWWWMSRYFLPWVAWAWLAPMPFAGVLALQYWHRVRARSPLWWRQLGMVFRRARLRELRAARDALCEKLRGLAAEFARVRPHEPLPLNLFSWRRFALAAARWLVIAGVAVFAVAWIVSWQRSRSGDLRAPGPDLGALPAATLAASLDDDERTLADIIGGLRDVEARAAELQAEFATGRRSFYRQADNDAVRQLLFSYLTYRTTLLSFIWKYQNHAQVADARLRARAFLLDLAAASTLYDASLKFVTRFGRAPETVRKLNEAEPAWNIPPGVYDLVKRNLLQAHTRDFMENAMREYRAAQPRFAGHDLVTPPPYAAFHAAIARHGASRAELTPLLLQENVTGPVAEVKRLGKGVSYRVQAFVSTWLGNTRIREPNQGRRLISPAQLAQIRAQLRPGDILLERQNWFLSRAFMPGFWAHAALYVGTTNDLARLGLADDERVRRHWRKFATRDEEGHEHVILEAVPQGVRMTTLEHCLGIADYAAVLRPRLGDPQIREAIARAFSHLGKPYDFDFDFFTTDKIVCTELVYRCYDGQLQFPLVDVMGRKTLPPTELAKKFVAERGRPDAQLECVCFLDGDETRGRAVFKDVETFAATIRRPGLTWLQPEEKN
jgi:1-acyl-sn-glycerol-3-phosphate acyltransferase